MNSMEAVRSLKVSSRGRSMLCVTNRWAWLTNTVTMSAPTYPRIGQVWETSLRPTNRFRTQLNKISMPWAMLSADAERLFSKTKYKYLTKKTTAITFGTLRKTKAFLRIWGLWMRNEVWTTHISKWIRCAHWVPLLRIRLTFCLWSVKVHRCTMNLSI